MFVKLVKYLNVFSAYYQIVSIYLLIARLQAISAYSAPPSYQMHRLIPVNLATLLLHYSHRLLGINIYCDLS